MSAMYFSSLVFVSCAVELGIGNTNDGPRSRLPSSLGTVIFDAVVKLL